MTNILELYAKLLVLVLLGFFLGRKLPAIAPKRLGQTLFWVGVPITIVSFIRRTDLSGPIWIAPAIAHTATLLGIFLAWLVIKGQSYWTNTTPPQQTRGSMFLAAMLGNTGYIGYPVILTVAGTKYFAWALFYDLLGSLFAAYGLGVILATHFGSSHQTQQRFWQVILINPALWSLGFGLLFRQVPLPKVVDLSLNGLAWTALSSSLILIGMRLSQLNSWHNFRLAGMSVGIKMLLVPLILGMTLPLLGLTTDTIQVIVLQMAMPPAFSTLLIAETFNLDKDLTVTALALGTLVLLFTLPIWLWLF
ncbi:MAG: AEC family transporter [Calothrix sp. MO_192.B10]|nr:AEC family transporter [Calothrix sp. MO_192.B10]